MEKFISRKSRLLAWHVAAYCGEQLMNEFILAIVADHRLHWMET